MCISCPTKKGIKNLPKVGTYYKVLSSTGLSDCQCFRYEMGINIIPQELQDVAMKRRKRMGGHFFVERAGAEAWRTNEEDIIAEFHIKREDIEYIGRTYWRGDHVTITAHRARRIK